MGWPVLFLVILASAVQGQEETCLSVEEDPYFLFGTKTAYIFANRGIANAKVHDVPGCQPAAFWLLNRHGSHNPEANEIIELQKLSDFKNNILRNYKDGSFRNNKQRVCSADLSLLERWEWNYRHNLTFAGDLTSDGYMTTQHLAQAWKQRYPGLLTTNRHDYLFKFVNDQRSTNTFRAFTEGLFGAQAEGFDVPRENDEKLLRPYKFCPQWTKQVEENNDTLLQRDIFESKQEYHEMISNISQRLGFNYDLNKETVHQMYQICRYNKAWDVSEISPWCAVFTREDLKRLEYVEDLETFYKYGYGSSLNQNIGCTLVKDMMNFFTNHADREGVQQPRSMIHFTEAPMILMTLTAMGARRDTAPLTGDNYHSNLVQARKWASSIMTPYNANLAAILYKCTPNGNFQVKDQHQVLFLENEKPMYIEGCRVGLCDWSMVKSKFGEVTSKCDLEFCNSATQLNGLLSVILTVIVYFIRF
ncbi:multiple inositol polyphosphate phosphatase 1 [Manduca sexta]|uniref:Multiple inositol polyphosphate phosphatase 1 n=1 Tax=Manduca sexta TaxID=7130 RepID=A0A921Z266_MANSE|nr:multiple inositol polyphosphate phosphatase 1 [Manduca sexta]XP_030023786.1 multiple inositol polyphosphate phosphatase 1 [Manduca sexta]XP_030023787.1 multiple inositol polyphosphate phosphatase 1 [Manduca sexta]KAG6448995.1 hypothetical protein O3G_MSEX005795 [Manduca sexta]KAG6448996.1 hypothetical protein O3G_MSEX005795 [Manduca sexta]KAG6448997.1 hypothetical protein O3G_MSEX005795 [Manduca sexta]KAG6448998.1 hypothetical protein O3G_MSEX005795 [Manduca sexta]